MVLPRWLRLTESMLTSCSTRTDCAYGQGCDHCRRAASIPICMSCSGKTIYRCRPPRPPFLHPTTPIGSLTSCKGRRPSVVCSTSILRAAERSRAVAKDSTTTCLLLPQSLQAGRQTTASHDAASHPIPLPMPASVRFAQARQK